MTQNPCPLCHSVKTIFFTNAQDRDYYLCTRCKLIFVPKVFLLNKTEEKKRYDLHENSINDKAYVQFLSPIVEAVQKRIDPPSFGLDFGSGPEPVLTELLKRKNYQLNIYDPFYAKNDIVLSKKYEFIILVEVAEHFFNPYQEFNKLIDMLSPKAYLFVMTSSTDNIVDFTKWPYQRDHTHVCFYANESLKYIAQKHKLSFEKISESLAIFQKI